MRKIILAFVLCTLSLCPLFSQEAFYIYRNDGDFNGFFYDEVQEMRYSKIDLDSVEHENYIMYEVQLADTTYRIPLASIDSIGFQQPEIKLNPKVKFIERDGYMPYFVSVNTNYITFKNLPSSKALQVGDIIIGLSTDPIAKNQYNISIGDLGSGSFSCVVTQIKNNNDGTTYVYGHPVESVGDVFEQYITVEEIGIFNGEQVQRRIAGCTPEGMPRKTKRISGDTTINIINLEGTFTHEWLPGGDSKVELSARIGVRFQMRVSYNIVRPVKVIVSCSRIATLSAKSSLGIALTKDFEKTLGDLITLPSITFPNVCPIFETNPIPELFIRANGTIEAQLNMPTMRLRIEDNVTFNNLNIFPVSYKIHLNPSVGEEQTDILDLSTVATFHGYAQAGIKFGVNVATASWFRKIIRGDVGVYLYCGPKAYGSISLSTDMQQNMPEYYLLQDAYLGISRLSLDLEAKARASVGGSHTIERTFFSTSASFFSDTLRLIPRFDSVAVDIKEKDVEYKLYPKPDNLLGDVRVAIGIYDGKTENLIKQVGEWELNEDNPHSMLSYTLPAMDLKANGYYVCPIIQGTWGTHICRDDGIQYNHPTVIEVLTDTITINVNDSLPQEVHFKSNSRNLWSTQELEGSGQNCIGRLTIQGINEEKGEYKLIVNHHKTWLLFDDYTRIYIVAGDGAKDTATILVNIQASDVEYLNLYIAYACFGSYYNIGNSFDDYNYETTATRMGKDTIHIYGYSTPSKYLEIKVEFNLVNMHYEEYGTKYIIFSEGDLVQRDKSYYSKDDQIIWYNKLTTATFDQIIGYANGDLIYLSGMDLHVLTSGVYSTSKGDYYTMQEPGGCYLVLSFKE